MSSERHDHIELLSPYVLMFTGTGDYKLGASGGRAGQHGGSAVVDLTLTWRRHAADRSSPGKRAGAARSSSCVCPYGKLHS